MLLSRKEVYNWLKTILRDGFKKDDATETISVNKGLTENEIDSLTCSFVNLLGKSEIPHPRNNTSKGELMSQFKVNSRFIDIDEKTIKLNKYGQLEAQLPLDQDEVIQRLLTDEAFFEKVKATLKPEDVMMGWVINYLLKNPFFLNKMAAIISVAQKLQAEGHDGVGNDEIEENLSENDESSDGEY